MQKVLSYFDLIPGMKYTEFCYFHNRRIPICIETLTVIEPRFGLWHKAGNEHMSAGKMQVLG